MTRPDGTRSAMEAGKEARIEKMLDEIHDKKSRRNRYRLHLRGEMKYLRTTLDWYRIGFVILFLVSIALAIRGCFLNTQLEVERELSGRQTLEVIPLQTSTWMRDLILHEETDSED